MSLEIVPYPIEDREHILLFLDHQRDLAMHGGDVVKRDAWIEIDRLLDCLNALGARAVKLTLGGTND
jgi:hypothetical protein